MKKVINIKEYFLDKQFWKEFEDFIPIWKEYWEPTPRNKVVRTYVDQHNAFTACTDKPCKLKSHAQKSGDNTPPAVNKNKN